LGGVNHFMDSKLYVGGLPYSTNATELERRFTEFGVLQSATIITDVMTGRSKGFGFVTFAAAAAAAAAIHTLHGAEFNGRTLTVNVARPLERRPRRAFGNQEGHDHELIKRIADLPLDRELGRTPLHRLGIDDSKTEDFTSTLHLPPEYSERLTIVEHLPTKLLRLVAADPRSVRGLTPRQFEEFIAELIEGLGFDNVLLTPASNDGGRDVIASNRIHGIPLTFYFECKRYAEGNAVQLGTLRSLLGVVAHHSKEANVGVLVTTSHFTRGAKELIANECRLDGKDYHGIVEWVDAYNRSSSGPTL